MVDKKQGSAYPDLENEVVTVENEFREDLALHLYSSFLMRQVDPLYPRRDWYTWPLALQKIPVTGGSKRYVDSELPERAHVQPTYPVNTQPVRKGGAFSRRITWVENATDATDDIELEIHAAIDERLASLNGGAMTSESPNDAATSYIVHQVRSKLDEVLHNLNHTVSQSRLHFTKRPLTDWQNVLLAGIGAFQPEGSWIDTLAFRELTEKCFKLFDEPKYSHEREAHISDDNDSDNSSEIAANGEPDVVTPENYMPFPASRVKTSKMRRRYERTMQSLPKRRKLARTRADLTQSVIANWTHVFDEYREMHWDEPHDPRRVAYDEINSVRDLKEFILRGTPNPGMESYARYSWPEPYPLIDEGSNDEFERGSNGEGRIDANPNIELQSDENESDDDSVEDSEEEVSVHEFTPGMDGHIYESDMITQEQLSSPTSSEKQSEDLPSSESSSDESSSGDEGIEADEQ
ncbi:hypothetical protein DICA1_E03554 [Diutina catenulata]